MRDRRLRIADGMGEGLVSALIIAFLALKVAEGTFQIESWPLSNVPMFALRKPREVTPFRMTLVGRRGGEQVTLGPADFGLTNTELGRQLRGRGMEGFFEGCRRLADVYNRNRPPARRLEALEVHIARILRPGVPDDPIEQVLPCPVPPAPGVR